jgi:hypothetical protein
MWKSLGELPEGPVMKSSLVDGLSLHLDGRAFADFWLGHICSFL